MNVFSIFLLVLCLSSKESGHSEPDFDLPPLGMTQRTQANIKS